MYLISTHKVDEAEAATTLLISICGNSRARARRARRLLQSI